MDPSALAGPGPVTASPVLREMATAALGVPFTVNWRGRPVPSKEYVAGPVLAPLGLSTTVPPDLVTPTVPKSMATVSLMAMGGMMVIEACPVAVAASVEDG